MVEKMIIDDDLTPLKEAPKPIQKRPMLFTILLLLGVTVIGSNSFLLSPILTDVSASLGASVTQVARAVASYGGATAFAGLLLIRYVQSMEYRTALLISGSILSVGILVTGLANHWQTLVVAQAITGLAAGIMLPVIYSMTAVIAPKGQESAVLGTVILGWSLSMVAGVPISAFVADIFTWRHSYYLATGLSLVATSGFLLLPVEPPINRGKATSLLSALQIPFAKWTLMLCFMYMLSFYGVYTFIGSHVHQFFGFSTSLAGLIVLAYGLGFGIASFIGKKLDELTPRRLIGPLFLGLSFIYLIFLFLSQVYWTLIVGSIIWGFINQLCLNCLVSILTQLDPNQRVRLMGIYSATAYGGAMVAGITFGVLFEVWEFTGVLVCASVLCAVAFIISMVAYR